MKLSKFFYFFILIFASCGRKTLILEDGATGITAVSTGTLSVKVSLAWVSTSDKYEVVQTCTKSGHSFSYETLDPIDDAYECNINIPESRLFYSRIKFEVEKPVLTEGCATIKFFPYYYRKSTAEAAEVPEEPTKPTDPGPAPVKGDPPNEDPNYATKLAEWTKAKKEFDDYPAKLAEYKIKLAIYNALPPIAKIDCSGLKTAPDKSCFGGVGREVPAFPTHDGFVSTNGKITFESPMAVYLSGDGNKFATNIDIPSTNITHIFIAGTQHHYRAYCEDIYGNYLVSMRLNIGDFDGSPPGSPDTDDYCTWSSGSSCGKDAVSF